MWEKGENAGDQRSFPFLSMFSKCLLHKVEIRDNKIKSNSLPQIPTFNTLTKKALENIVGKGENASNQHFLLFPQCFLLFLKQLSIFQAHLICRLQSLSI